VVVGGSRLTGDAGVLGTALAVVLAFSLAQGSWEWFSTYLGVTLLAWYCPLAMYRCGRRTDGLHTGGVWRRSRWWWVCAWH